MLYLLLILLLGPYPCPVKRDAHGKIVRNHAAVRNFLALHHVTATPTDSVVDHVMPLCACGSDTPSNMQMQGVQEAKAKDVLEKQACYKLAHALQAPVSSVDLDPLTNR